MFSSISRAFPNSQVTTQFVATETISLATTDNIDFQINGASHGQYATANASDVVVAAVTAPVDFLYTAFYNYTINGVPQVFAVICQKPFTFHVIDPKKQWYNYFPTDHTLTYQTPSGKNYPVTLGATTNLLTSDCHVVMDDNSNAAYFYNASGILISKISLPSAPIDYVRIYGTNEVLILCFGGSLYNVQATLSKNPIPRLNAILNYSEFVDLTYVSRIPGEDEITYLRKIRSTKSVPAATCLDYDGSYVWVAGNGTIWILDPTMSYNLIATYNFDEYAFGIAAFPDSSAAIITTQSNKIFSVTNAGVFTELRQGIALGQPIRVDTRICIPEGETGEIFVYDTVTNQFVDSFFTGGFSPSYTQVRDNLLYICGNDSPEVLVYDFSFHLVKTLTFGYKVTWVSVLGGSIIASHWLKDFTLLETKDLYRIIPFQFKPVTAPVSHVGSNLITAQLLGVQSVTTYTPPGVVLWINGVRSNSAGTVGAQLNNGDVFAISYAVHVAGVQQVPCIIGDSAFDFQVKAVAQTYFPRYFDFSIKLPDANGLYSESFTMPKHLQPVLMGIEYGSLKLNGLDYDGTLMVNPNDIVTVTVYAGLDKQVSSGLAPIFTLGQRQFAIPISLNPALSSPVVISYNGLYPLSQVEQDTVVSGDTAIYQFVIPNYYTVTITKNGVLVVGDYYSQFAGGDLLAVSFVSSYKQYDTNVVYVLGAQIFKFIAQNIVPTPIDFLSFPALEQPYVRFNPPILTGAEEIIDMPTQSFITGAFVPEVTEPPIIQCVTANIAVSGITGNFSANLGISGGNSFFIINGVITSDFYVNVKLGTEIALGRTVESYFDSNVTITQVYTDVDDDVVELVVGTWEIVNQTMGLPNFTHAGALALTLNSSAMINRDRLIGGKSMVKNRSTQLTSRRHNTAIGRSHDLLDFKNKNKSRRDISVAQYMKSAHVMLTMNNAGLNRAAVTKFDRTSNMISRSAHSKFVAVNNLISLGNKSEFTNVNLEIARSAHSAFMRTSISIARSAHSAFLETNTEIARSAHSAFMRTSISIARSAHSAFLELNTEIARSAHSAFTSPGVFIVVRSAKTEFLELNTEIARAAHSDFYRIGPMVARANNSEFYRIGPMIARADHSEFYRIGPMVTRSNHSEFYRIGPMIARSDHSEFYRIGPNIARSAHSKFSSTSLSIARSAHSKSLEIGFAFQNAYGAIQLRSADKQSVMSSARLIISNDKQSVMSGTRLLSTNGTRSGPNLPIRIKSDDILGLGNNTRLLSNTVALSYGPKPLQDPNRDKQTLLIFPSNLEINTMISDHTHYEKLINDYGTNRNYSYKIDFNYFDNNQILPIKLEATADAKVRIQAYENLQLPEPVIRNAYGDNNPNLILLRTSYGHNNPDSFVIRSQYDKNDFDSFVIRTNYDRDHVNIKLIKTMFVHENPETRLLKMIVGHDNPETRLLKMISSHDNPETRLIKMISSHDNPETRLLKMISSHDNPETRLLKMISSHDNPETRLLKMISSHDNPDTIMIKPIYVHDNPDTIMIKPIYVHDNPNVPLIRPLYVQAQSDDILIRPKYIQNYQSLILTSAHYKPNTNLSDILISVQIKQESTSSVVTRRLQIQQNTIPFIPVRPSFKVDSGYTMIMKFTYAEMDRGVVWQEDITTEYGAFATEHDAIAAAAGYSHFKPELIYGTNFYTYRVIFDTGLICKIPRGRYAVAWLLHGG